MNTRSKHSLFASLVACSIVLSAPALGDDVIRLSEPVETTDTYEVFGSPAPKDAKVIELSDLLEGGEDYLGQSILVSTRVAQVCQKKGCFFIAQDGDHVARVSFVDYSFFVPTDISGKTVTLAGELVRVELSPEQAEHFSEDIAEGGGVKPGPRYEIVATSVRVPLESTGP